MFIPFPGDMGIMSLRAGRYSIWTGPWLADDRLRWSLRRLGANPQACDQALDLPLPLAVGGTQLLGSTEAWPGEAVDPVLGPVRVTWIRVPAGTADGNLFISRQRAAYIPPTPSPHASIRVCSGPCGAIGACQPLETSLDITVTPVITIPTVASVPTVLELRGTSAPFNETIRIDM
jgi:hypothetical protein